MKYAVLETNQGKRAKPTVKSGSVEIADNMHTDSRKEKQLMKGRVKVWRRSYRMKLPSRSKGSGHSCQDLNVASVNVEKSRSERRKGG